MTPELNVQKSGADKAATRSGGHSVLEYTAIGRSWLCQNSTLRMSIGSTLWLSGHAERGCWIVWVVCEYINCDAVTLSMNRQPK